jgi:3-dehydroquinate dehydratase type I
VRPKIAVSIPARSVSEASRMIRKAHRLGADLAEIRLDYLETEESIDRIVQIGAMPLIATFRSSLNGGAREVKQEKRLEALVAAAEAGFEYVDVEVNTKGVQALVDRIHAAGARTIASHHDLKGTPSDIQLRRVLRLCRATHATLSKLVTTVRRLEDNLRLLAFVREASRSGGVVCFGMGKLGIHSRVFSPVYGAAFTFASLNDRESVAPGQIPLRKMQRIYAELGYS